MVGLGEIDEFEVEAEGACELVGGGQIEGVDAGESLLEVGGGGFLIGSSDLWRFGFAAGDGGAAKSFDGFVERLAGLFAEDLAEQHAERADVAAQRSFFELAGGGL